MKRPKLRGAHMLPVLLILAFAAAIWWGSQPPPKPPKTPLALELAWQHFRDHATVAIVGVPMPMTDLLVIVANEKNHTLTGHAMRWQRAPRGRAAAIEIGWKDRLGNRSIATWLVFPNGDIVEFDDNAKAFGQTMTAAKLRIAGHEFTIPVFEGDT